LIGANLYVYFSLAFLIWMPVGAPEGADTRLSARARVSRWAKRLS
jgi:hypothetical protein